MVENYSEVTSQYTEGLLGLTFNSKPIINNLTIIADENVGASSVIVRLIESRIAQAETDKKLPVIYLLDSIIKNVGGVYLQLFSKNIINTYCNAFEKLDTNNRISMVHLLKTWIGVFPQEQVSAIQDRISALVPSNPATQPTNQPNAIHVNPRYLQRPPAERGGPPTGAGRGNPPPPSAKGAKAPPPARPTSAQGGKGPVQAKGTMKAAPSPTQPLKNPAKLAAGPPPAKPAATPTSPQAGGAPKPAAPKPAAPKPPVKMGEGPTGTAERPAGAPSMKKVAPAVAKVGAKPAPPGSKPAPPRASPTKPAIKAEGAATSPPSGRPPGAPGAGRGAGGVTTGTGGTGPGGSAGGAGRGTTGPGTNGRVAPRPAEQKDLKPSGRGRVEHHRGLGEEREHPYRRPPPRESKFGTGERNERGKASNNPDIQTQTNAVNSLLQLLGEQKGGMSNPSNTSSVDAYTPQPFNQFNQQQFQQFPQQFNNNFGYQQQFPQQFNNNNINNQFSQQQFPFQQQSFNNNMNSNQFSQFNQQPMSPQGNAPVAPFMQPLANITQTQRTGPGQGFLGNQPQLKPTPPAFTKPPFQNTPNPSFTPMGGAGGMGGGMGIGAGMGGGMGMGAGIGGGMGTGMGGGMGAMGGMGNMGAMGAMGNMGGGMGGGMGNMGNMGAMGNMSNMGGVGGGMGGGVGGGMGMGGMAAKPVPPSALGPTGSLTDLKRQDRYVITKLYNEFTLQCKICALRFNDSDRMAKHLDWHFTTNRKEKMRAKQAMSRPWYHTEEEWAESQGSEASEKASTPFFETEIEETPAEAPEPSVVADENQPICPICHETFEQFWDAEAEEWMYRAAMINPMTGTIVHQKCYNPDAPMTSPPVSPRAASPMDTTANTTPPLSFTTPPPSSTTSDTQSTTTTTVVEPYAGVQGIDDLAF